jgi:RNA polymerase sigma-70 factor, ECF subfamily
MTEDQLGQTDGQLGEQVVQAWHDHRPYLVDLAFRMLGDIGAAEDGVPFGSIAQTVGRPVPTCRQLARRARQKIADSQGTATFEVGAAEHRQVTEKFIAAAAHGDLDGLLQVLAPDAWGDFDGGPGDPQAGRVTHGAVQVARRLLYYWGPGTTLVSLPVAGQPVLLGFTGRVLAGILVFTMRAGKIQAVHVIGDPRQLAFVSSQLR